MRKKIHCVLCNTEVKVSRLESHLQHKCIKRPVKCDICQQSSPFSDFRQMHGNHCEETVISCVFCSEKMFYKEIADHLCDCSALDKLVNEYSGKLPLKYKKEFFKAINCIKLIITQPDFHASVRHREYLGLIPKFPILLFIFFILLIFIVI